eukprot:TRINITY_DN256_c0_g1_i7.p1 TRINITY_DN256_c0_g1~~TRINITY_DN256_c0_g1_i7.p1  ORF type:complete len:115 (-),score=0.26 TRINITY_DN256_c0_g1_i7:536-880(-)
MVFLLNPIVDYHLLAEAYYESQLVFQKPGIFFLLNFKTPSGIFLTLWILKAHPVNPGIVLFSVPRLALMIFGIYFSNSGNRFCLKNNLFQTVTFLPDNKIFSFNQSCLASIYCI